jgi:recombinational DNA repair ATPase RecF
VYGSVVPTMYITEVILDGFKSYPNRTVISGWDAEFNAITGLNGSGKSNILDAICFVLGISNLSQVRTATCIVRPWGPLTPRHTARVRCARATCRTSCTSAGRLASPRRP